jgi:sec-independent protein translocase protein TatB
MFNIGAGEIALICVAALLILGPQRLPELARGIGKFMRDFRRQTDEVRSTLETEFYRMDQELLRDAPRPELRKIPAALSVPPPAEPDEPDPESGSTASAEPVLPPGDEMQAQHAEPAGESGESDASSDGSFERTAPGLAKAEGS